MRIFVLLFILLLPLGSIAQGPGGEPCDGQYKNTQLTASSIEPLLENHAAWYAENRSRLKKSLKKADPRRANFCRAILASLDLRGVNLIGADLSEATLTNTNLSGADLTRADLSRANLKAADLSGATLFHTRMPDAIAPAASLSGANLSHAELPRAILNNAVFTGADMGHADLTAANLTDADLSRAQLFSTDLSAAILDRASLADASGDSADLTRAKLRGTDLSGFRVTNAVVEYANYEPGAGQQPDIDIFSQAIGLATLRYERPRALFNLRKLFMNAGYEKQERQVTYAIHSGRVRRLLGDDPLPGDADGLAGRLEGIVAWAAFDLTTRWGMEPGRALVLLVLLIPIFMLAYALALRAPGRDGIWRVWSDERVRRDLGGDEPELIAAGGFAAIRLAFYFSLLSAFHIGWRDINVGNWIARIQPREYTLRASGWARSVSGIQSLLSVYLLAIWALTTFGRPFG